MKIQFNSFNGWKDDWKNWRIIHWFALTAVFEPPRHFNPIIEIHLWIFNFDFRISLFKWEEK